MDELNKLLRGMAPGQIEEAVQLLQQYTATNRRAEKGEETLTGNDANGSSINGESSSVGTSNDDDTLSSVIALALRQAASGGVNTNSNTINGVKDDYEDEDDIPLALLLQSRQALLRKKSNRSTAQRKTLEDSTNNELKEQQENEQQQEEPQQSTEENRTPNRKGGKSSGKALNNQQQTSPSNTACGLANFGFLSAAKKPTVALGDKNKLFTPFVQDKRIVPAALQFWNQKSDTAKEEEEKEQLPAHIREEEEVSVVRQTIAVDEDTSSLMHSPVLGFGENEEQHQQEGEGVEEGKKSKSKQKESQLQGGRAARCYASFTDMIDSVTYVTPPLHCPCGFHVHTPAPRVGFCDEVVFCGFYAVGYDPCQSRPPYFGTHNSQDSYNKEELLGLARFPVGTAMPQMSNLDYQYDSGDDWDVVDGDEDIGASSSDNDDDGASDDSNSCNSNSSNAFMGDSGDDFINDNDEDDDSDAELQRKMVEARQRRLNRLRHKDKLVPAFSGPFVGLAMIDHPLREYDRLDRVSSTLEGSAFTALLEQELRAAGTITSAASAVGNNNNNSNNIGGGVGGADKVNGNDMITNTISNNNGLVTMVTDIGNEELLEQQQQQQRLLAAALRNRREMLPEELDALHVIIAANGKISFKAIVEALQQQQLCVGVARAEILRTICRYYERKHNTMVRRDEPWSATDERLYARQERRKAAKKNKMNNNTNNNNNDGGKEKSGDGQGEDLAVARATSGGRGEMDNNNDDGEGEGEDGVESDEDSEENISLVALASKRPRSESRENNSV
ncbi:Chromatin assembly factor 1 subunit A [Trypanosoma melophagium]|uniref:Chromatin assembly factor 1 subunit A n=1 Tax=Trypanosoma melophagium TaxID=715481 RepID=UPI003519FC68|nr:Chromatin assembly factor 1 subunit A [Trypanosoma melophagium]